MDTSTNMKLSTTYYQTRNTRIAQNTTTLHNIDNSSTHIINNMHIGSLNTKHNINSSYLASRIHTTTFTKTSDYPLIPQTCNAPYASTPPSSLIPCPLSFTLYPSPLIPHPSPFLLHSCSEITPDKFWKTLETMVEDLKKKNFSP